MITKLANELTEQEQHKNQYLRNAGIGAGTGVAAFGLGGLATEGVKNIRDYRFYKSNFGRAVDYFRKNLNLSPEQLKLFNKDPASYEPSLAPFKDPYTPKARLQNTVGAGIGGSVAGSLLGTGLGAGYTYLKNRNNQQSKTN